MITRLNLASQPFRNRTLPWAVASVVSLVSLLALVYFVLEGQRVGAEAARAERQEQQLRSEMSALQQQAEDIKESLTPEQLATLEAAHHLVERRGFSWSRLFADLESALPSGVRVSRISVGQVTKRGEQTRADLELTVVARDPTSVTGMMAEMSRVGTFSAVPLRETQKTSREETGYEWTLRVSYVQGGARPNVEAGTGEAGAAGSSTVDRAAAEGARE